MKENGTFCDIFFLCDSINFKSNRWKVNLEVKNCSKSCREETNCNDWVKGCSKGFSRKIYVSSKFI